MTLALLALSVACMSPEPLDLRVVAQSAAGESTELWVRGGRVVEARGRTPEAKVTLFADRVTPGFIDAHAHPEGLGAMLGEASLSGHRSRADTLSALAATAGQLAPGAWLLGRGWDQTDWSDNPDAAFPTAAQLDAAVRDRPVAVRRVDGHAIWLNTAALQAAGITAQTPDPPGGRILRDADGAPSGVLIDAAMALVSPPEPTHEERVARLLRAQDEILRSGLVGVHAMGVDDATLAALREIERRGALKLRLWVYLTPESEAAERLLQTGPERFDRLHLVGVKAFADGALGSRGALLREDYADDPGNRGLAQASWESLAELASRARAARASFAVHAIGDAGVAMALDALERVGAWDLPPRIEHAQVVDPRDLARFVKLGVVASMQPTHATSDAPWAEARLGPERVRWAYAWRSALQAGVPLAFGSDFPVEQVSPSYGLWSATTRRIEPDSPPFTPEQILTMDEAIAAFTRGPYAAIGQPTPSLEPGEEADLTLWDVELQGGQPRWTPIATVIGGEIGFRL